MTSLNARAAVTVARHANGDTRHLLEMLGLVDDHGRLQPDDLRAYDVGAAQPEKGIPSRAPLDGPDHPEQFTSPPALRQLPPPELKRATPRQKTAPKPRAVKPRKEAQCGTPSGERRHRRRGEPVCEPCKEAHNAVQRKRDAAARARAKSRPAPARRDAARCGTVGGYSAHRRRLEDICEPCKVAIRGYWKARYDRAKTAARKAV
jgi:hypothetical protein